jgi:hypothetical protein
MRTRESVERFRSESKDRKLVGDFQEVILKKQLVVIVKIYRGTCHK